MAKYWMGNVSMTVLAGSLLAACSDAPVDIGEKNTQLAKSDLAAYAATWKGYVEAYQFEDETDVVRLVLDEQGQGTLRFGERPLFGPATDPMAFHPPQSSWSGGGFPGSIWSGFGYTVRNTRVETERVRLEAGSMEVFSSYCALQTPYFNKDMVSDSTVYLCIQGPNGVFDPSGSCYVYVEGATIAVSCEQVHMCLAAYTGRQGCTCTETSCTIDTSYQDVALDAALDDSQENLTGTMLIGTDRLTVHLERQ